MLSVGISESCPHQRSPASPDTVIAVSCRGNGSRFAETTSKTAKPRNHKTLFMRVMGVGLEVRLIHTITATDAPFHDDQKPIKSTVSMTACLLRRTCEDWATGLYSPDMF